jgi:hypothetical protein
MTQTLQGALQAAIRSALNCANDFNGDLHAMCDMYGITAGPISGRLIPAASRFDASITDASSALNYFLQNPQNACGTLALDFTTATSLDPRITFSRGSQATLFDSTGALVYAKHNLLLQSQTFDNASWTKTRSSVTQDTAVAPDGTTTADSLVEDGTAANTHDLRQAVTNTGTNTWALSVYLKAVNRSWALIELQNATATSNRARAWFDLQNGVVGTGNTAGSGVTYVSHSIQNVGNGWYRCILVGTADSAVTLVQAWLEGTTADSVTGYNGVNGQTSVYIWGAQLNLTAMEGGVTSSLSTYYPTVASAYYAPRFDYNPSTLAAQGLLIEEQRTNSIRNNTMQGAVAGTPGTVPTNWFIDSATGNLTTRQIVGIGTESGITYIDVRFVTSGVYGASAYFDSSTGIAALNGQTWTSSVYVRMVGGSSTNVTHAISIVENNVSGTFLAGGDSSSTTPTSGLLASNRLSYTRTNTNASTAFVQTRLRIDFTGAADITLRIGLPQLEQGAFATSVIPTTTTALTRNADVASMTGTNFSSWYNQTEGTFVCNFVDPQSGISGAFFPGIFSASDNSTSNRITCYRDAAVDYKTVVTTSGVLQSNLTNAAVSTSQRRIASAYKLNDFAVCGQGGSVATDTSGTVPTVDRFYVGSNQTGGSQLCGYIQRISYYPVRLPNSTLQALTA